MNPVASSFAFDPDPRLYDEVMGPIYFEGYAVETARRLMAFRPREVLETACGTGRLTHQLDLQLPASVSITATDIHPLMLSYAAGKFPSPGRIRWQEADALDLPFGDASFDAVACQFGAMFFSDKGKGFAEACRVLKPGGIFLFSVWDKLDHNPMAAADREVMKDFFGGELPAQLRTAFSMSHPDSTRELLLANGFAEVNTELLRLPCEAPSAAVLTEAFVEGSSVRALVREAGPQKVAALKERLRESLEKRFGNPVRSTMQAFLFTAKAGGQRIA